MSDDNHKTKAALIKELTLLRRRIDDLEKLAHEHKQVAEALKQKEAVLHSIFSTVPVAIGVLSSDRTFQLVNERISEIFGYSPDELVGTTTQRLYISEEEYARVGHDLYTDELWQGGISCTEAKMRHKNGSIVYALITGVALEPNNPAAGSVSTVQDVTERKKAEHALKESEERFSKAFHANPAPMCISDIKTGRFLDANERWLSLIGYTREELVGATSLELNMYADPGTRECAVERLRRDGFFREAELRVITKSGHILDMLWSAEIINLDGQEAILSLLIDVTERKQVELRLLESLGLFQATLESTASGILVVDLNQKIVNYNRRFVEMWRIPNEIMVLREDENVLAHILNQLSEPELFLEDIRKLYAHPKTESHDLIFFKDGRIFERYSIPTYRGSDIVGRVWSFHDITMQKQTEEALRKSEIKYRRLHESMTDAFISVDMTGNILETNKSFQSMVGYTEEELVHLHYDNLTPAIWHASEAEIIDTQVLKRGYSDIYEKEYRRKNGTCFPVELRSYLIRDEEGLPIGMWAIVRDITERKQAEQTLRKSEARLNQTLDAVNEAVWEWHIPTGRAFFSPKYYTMLGYEPYEFPQDYSAWEKLVHPDDVFQAESEICEHVANNEAFSIQFRMQTKAGDWCWILSRGKAIEWDDYGKPVRMVGTHTDITEHKRMEEELFRTHKLESLGVLAGGIAHDFNNAMGMIQGYIDLSLSELPSDHISRPWLQRAMESMQLTRDLTSKLITFSRGGAPRKELTDVTGLLKDTVRNTLFESPVNVTFDFADDLWPIELDRLQAKQCFSNLTINAMEAMPAGGNLTVRVENALISDQEGLDLQEGAYLKITFTDNGVGIPKEHLSKVFDPYFSTKPMSSHKGLGLGLAVCYSILKKHDGYITVQSEPGAGASFILYFPAHPERIKEKERPKAASDIAGRILIMDDEPNMREVTRAYLERMGYEVTDVRDGQEAVVAYKKGLDAGKSFDLVMLDLMVRHGVGGLLAMERILKIDSSVKAIIISGYVDDPVIENYKKHGFLGVLKKPFLKEELELL